MRDAKSHLITIIAATPHSVLRLVAAGSFAAVLSSVSACSTAPSSNVATSTAANTFAAIETETGAIDEIGVIGEIGAADEIGAIDVGAPAQDDAGIIEVDSPTDGAVEIGGDDTAEVAAVTAEACLKADVDANGKVDIFDIGRIGNAYKAGIYDLFFDINTDGLVNFFDLAAASGVYGCTYTPTVVEGSWQLSGTEGSKELHAGGFAIAEICLEQESQTFHPKPRVEAALGGRAFTAKGECILVKGASIKVAHSYNSSHGGRMRIRSAPNALTAFEVPMIDESSFALPTGGRLRSAEVCLTGLGDNITHDPELLVTNGSTTVTHRFQRSPYDTKACLRVAGSSIIVRRKMNTYGTPLVGNYQWLEAGTLLVGITAQE